MKVEISIWVNMFVILAKPMRFLKLLYCTLVQRAQIVTFKGCSDTFQGAPETFEKQVGSFLHSRAILYWRALKM